MLTSVDWHTLFVPSHSVVELIIRGSLMYLLLIAAMRILRRNAGALGTADLLVVVLVADAAQNGMAGEYRSITEGAVLVATLFAWNHLLDWLSFRSLRMRRLLSAEPLQLIARGAICWEHLRKELMSEDELREQLRQQGVDDVADVRACFLESDGHISVIKYRGDDGNAASPRHAPA